MAKIYQLITSVQLGGAEIIAFDLAENCQKGDWEFVIMEVFRTNNAYALEKKKELSDKNIPAVSLYRGSKRMGLIVSPFKLAYFIWKEKPQIIHSHTDLADFVLSVALRMISFFRIATPKVVRTIHNTQLWPTHHALGKFTEAGYSQEKIVGVSKSALEAYNVLRKKNCLTPSSHQQLIYNGCHVPQKNAHPFTIHTDKINIAFCGRFEDYKGMDVLIPAIKQVNKQFPEVFFFHIIGSGTYKDKLVNLSETYANVKLYDAVPNISTKLHAFDFLFMPSHFEGLGLISIEASFSKVPVIASFAPGLDETLPTDWPLRFHLNSNEELIQIFENIKNRVYDVDALKEMAYKFVYEEFSSQKMNNAYAKLYKGAL